MQPQGEWVDEYDKEGPPGLLRQIAAATGGEAFFLGYTPEPGAAGFRAVKVRVQPYDKRRLVVRCRSGYQR